MKYFSLNFKATETSNISIGTSTRGPMTVAKASFDARPKVAIETAIANSKLFEAAVNDKEVAFG